jgi:glycosyltransferase involved in cell wall biosynthesis
MKPPQVTVLMPVYNAKRFLGPAIRSVLAQTFVHFELLIVDDGSTDDTEQIIRSFPDGRIRVLSNRTNIGLIKSLNRGIGEAQGKYIARLDADDLCLPTRLADQVDVLESQNDVGLVASWTEVIDEDDRTKGFGRWCLSPEAIYYVLHFRQCLTHSSVMFRTGLARELGGYSEQAIRTEDFDLWHRFSKVCRIIQLQKVLVKWRTHTASVTGTGTKEMEQNALRLAEQYVSEVTGEEWPPEIVKALVECRSVRYLRQDQLANFPAGLKNVQERIVAAAPEGYDMHELCSYIDIETAKYSYILRSLGKPFQTNLPTRASLLGFMYYLISYCRLPLTCRLVPRSHF